MALARVSSGVSVLDYVLVFENTMLLTLYAFVS